MVDKVQLPPCMIFKLPVLIYSLWDWILDLQARQLSYFL